MISNSIGISSLTAQLAKLKKLPLSFFASLGVRDIKNGIYIPYYLMDGSLAPRRQIRNGLSAKEGFSWTGTGEITPYGLNRPISENLILVEGSSDCWTLWFYGYCALGLPGATTAKIFNAKHLAGVKTIYVWQEPDRGGELFVSGIQKRLYEIGFLGKAKVIKQDIHKDPSEIHIKDGKDFKKIMDYFLLTAKLLPLYIQPTPKQTRRFSEMRGTLTDTQIKNAAKFPMEELLNVKCGSSIICPNHPDKKPSLWIKGFAFCFVCGYKVDSIDWLRRVKGLTFREAVIALNG